jgi:hypothetical protein
LLLVLLLIDSEGVVSRYHDESAVEVALLAGLAAAHWLVLHVSCKGAPHFFLLQIFLRLRLDLDELTAFDNLSKLFFVNTLIHDCHDVLDHALVDRLLLYDGLLHHLLDYHVSAAFIVTRKQDAN